MIWVTPAASFCVPVSSTSTGLLFLHEERSPDSSCSKLPLQFALPSRTCFDVYSPTPCKQSSIGADQLQQPVGRDHMQLATAKFRDCGAPLQIGSNMSLRQVANLTSKLQKTKCHSSSFGTWMLPLCCSSSWCYWPLSHGSSYMPSCCLSELEWPTCLD